MAQLLQTAMTSRFARLCRHAPGAALLAVLILALCTATTSHAQGASPVQLVGNFSYQVEGNQVALAAADIDNTSTTYTTGSLELQLWLTTSPFSGGTIQGYDIATYPLTVNGAAFLSPGESAQVDATVPLVNLPPPGSYYSTLVVAEYTQNCGTATGYCTDAWGNFSTPFVIGDSNNTSSYGNLVLGKNSYVASFNPNTLTFDVSSLSNTSQTYTTGTLRLEWWLTATPYDGKSIPGNRIAMFTIQNSSNGQLTPGQWFQDLQGTVPLVNLPPPGTYYVSILVTEYRENCGSTDGYCVDTYNNYQNQQVIPNPAPTTTSPQSSGSPASGGSPASSGASSGGGGAIGTLGLAILAALLLLRMLRGWRVSGKK